MSLIKSSCSATHTKAPMSPTRRVPIVRVAPKSATGAGSAEPNTACRAKAAAWRDPTTTGKRYDIAALPPGARRCSFIHLATFASLWQAKPAYRRHYSLPGVDLSLKSAKVGLDAPLRLDGERRS